MHAIVGSNASYLPIYSEARERIIFGISSLVSLGRESELWLERVARSKKRRILIFLIDL